MSRRSTPAAASPLADALAALAIRLRCNPFYLAYAFDTDADDVEVAFVRDRSNRPYLLWQKERWAETSKRIGLHDSDPDLGQRWPDHMQTLVARPKVIAALERRIGK